MKIEIELENCLSEEDMREAALDVFRSMVARSLERNERYFGGMGAWLSNMAYCTILEECGRYVEGGGEEIRRRIAEQVDKHIGDLSAYTVYHYNYDTGEPMNEGARIVEAAIVANREKVEGRVRELLDDVPAKSLRNEIADTVERFTDEWLRGDAE
ncbi:MAG: hypothetical protein IJ087_01430 [Eggerthellaceae bacterium]|nr:hypothetical protein [Eggerthellaceae bacterium]